MNLDLSSGQRLCVTVLKPGETQAETMSATVVAVAQQVIEIVPEGLLAVGTAVKIEWNAFIVLAEVISKPARTVTGHTFLRIRHSFRRDVVELLSRRWS